MKKHSSKIRKFTPSILLLLVVFASSVLASGWNPPTTDYPTQAAGFGAPLNTSTNSQTKQGALTAAGFVGTNGFLLGNSTQTQARLYVAAPAPTALSTVLSQKLCIGTDLSNTTNDSCVTNSWPAGANPQIQRALIENIPSDWFNGNTYLYSIPNPSYTYNQYDRKYINFCQWALTNIPVPPFTTLNDGTWIAVGSDHCADHGGGHVHCDTYNGTEIQCSYIRFITGASALQAGQSGLSDASAGESCSLGADNDVINPGDSVTLSWYSANAVSPSSITNPNGNPYNNYTIPSSGLPGGSVTTGPINNLPTTYTATFTMPSGRTCTAQAQLTTPSQVDSNSGCGAHNNCL